jgi:hypothetical protein
MKTYIVATVCIISLSACLQNREVRVSGRVEGKDSMILFRLGDREHRLHVDANNSFSGKIPLQESTYAYAYLSNRRIFLFLSPGEHLEMIVNAPPVPPLFTGSLAAINNYLVEQGEYLTFEQDILLQDEDTFVNGMEKAILVRTLLLEAKNLGHEFSVIESERVGYLAAGQAMRYSAIARSRLPDSARHGYRAGPRLHDFISQFPVDNEKMANISGFLQFIVAYYMSEIERSKNIRKVLVDIQKRVKTPKIKDHLLSELIYNYIYRQGISESDYLLALCWREMRDTTLIMKEIGRAHV